MKVGDTVKLARVHRFHPVVISSQLGKTGEVVDVKDGGEAVKVRFGTALIGHWLKPEYLEVVK
jgi:hypothetical protein